MNEEQNTINTKLRERSGNIDLDGCLIDFLYTLIRDHLPAGIVEELVRDAEISSRTGPTNQYSNGWLALYARDIAHRLVK